MPVILAADPRGHPSPERAAAALEAAGLNPYLLLAPGAVARTQYAEVGLSVARGRFVLLSVEDLPLPGLDPARQAHIEQAAAHLARRWGLVWRGSVEAGRVQVAFGGEVPYLPGDDPDDAGLRLHEAVLSVHHAHQALRQRALNAAWRAGAIFQAA